MPRRHHVGVQINEYEYVYGGYTGVSTLNDLWVYNNNVNKWTKKRNSSLEGRQGHIATVYNNEMYVFGGVTQTQVASNEFFKYSPSTGTWTVLPSPISMPKRNHGSGAIYDGKWYIFAGHSATAGAINDYKDLWVYDFTSQLWSQKTSNQYRRSASISVFYQGKFYCFGGDSDQPNDAPISIYNPITDTWEEKTAPWGYLHKPTAIVYGDYIYVYGGNNPSNTSQLRKYNPIDNTYVLLADGLEAVNSHSAVLYNSKMRIFGGNSGATSTSNRHYEYDFLTNQWNDLN